jgi:DNA-binding NarL/FixJ family response regulator
LISYPSLVSSLEKAIRPEDCLELLAESRRTLGFDIVGFRNNIHEPLCQQLDNWRHWGTHFGWPDKLLFERQNIQTFDFTNVGTNRDTSHILTCNTQQASKHSQNGPLAHVQRSLLTQMRAHDLNQWVFALIRRPFGQFGSVVWIRQKDGLHREPTPQSLHRLEHVATLFLGAMDTTGAWREFAMLTSRELQCLELAASGQSDKEIARAINRSMDTARFHMKKAIHDLGAKNRTQAVVTALKRNLIFSNGVNI